MEAARLLRLMQPQRALRPSIHPPSLRNQCLVDSHVTIAPDGDCATLGAAICVASRKYNSVYNGRRCCTGPTTAASCERSRFCTIGVGPEPLALRNESFVNQLTVVPALGREAKYIPNADGRNASRIEAQSLPTLPFLCPCVPDIGIIFLWKTVLIILTLHLRANFRATEAALFGLSKVLVWQNRSSKM
jgi:hypothetical protein